MSDTLPATPPPRRPPWWLRTLRRMLMWMVRIRREHPSADEPAVDPNKPLCYVIERHGLSNLLILEQACQEAALPSPLVPMPEGWLSGRRAVLALTRREGLLIGRARSIGQSQGLAELLAAVDRTPDLDIQIVPVSIFVGRAPERQSGWFSVLFSENWAVGGRLRRLMALMLNGRDTLVQFSPPISLRQLVDENLGPARSARKAARVLRAHLRRIKTAVMGPDLSHRRTVVDALLRKPAIREAVEAVAVREGITRSKAEARARSYALEIAADYSHPVVRSLSFILTGFWNRIYDGVKVHHLDTLKRIAPGHEVVYVPCHRSHIDYLLLSYLLYRNDLVPPHIAAGVNLNLPVVGSILRRGGAFFLRRSFKANALYSTVFAEYVTALVAQGVALEYFIEGGRSRTGRLLAPRAGMLSMTVKSALREGRRPVAFQPVYIGYEKLIEGRSYLGELSGREKKKESLFGLGRAFGVLRKKYGRVTVSLGEPILLSQVLAEYDPDWRATSAREERPPWFQTAVNSLAERILVRINQAADVNPINLLALVILSTPKHSVGEADLRAALATAKTLLTELPYSDRSTVSELDPEQIIAYGERLGVLQRIAHPLGDVLTVSGDEAVLLSYYRNNVQHLMVAAAWVSCCFLDNRRFSRSAILRLGKLVYPFIQSELFLADSVEAFGQRVQQTIELFVRLKLLDSDPTGRVLSRPPGGTGQAFQLPLFGHSLLQAFERYYICIAVLVKHGPGTLSAAELENLCQLTAQRLGLLLELNAPEFFDRALFRNFIQMLKARKIVWTDEQGRLAFSSLIESIHKDARVILSRDIRHGILKLAPEARAALDGT